MSIYWNEARDQILREGWVADHSCREIASRLGCSFNSVSSRARRLDLAARPSPVRPDWRQARDDLAEEMANGCPTLSEAARRLHIAQNRAAEHWARIKQDLGDAQCR